MLEVKYDWHGDQQLTSSIVYTSHLTASEILIYTFMYTYKHMYIQVDSLKNPEIDGDRSLRTKIWDSTDSIF